MKIRSFLSAGTTRRTVLRHAALAGAAAFGSPGWANPAGKHKKKKPSAPTGLTATANVNHTVLLSWDANRRHQRVTGYNVYRQPLGSTEATLVGTVPGTSFTDTGVALVGGTSWTYFLTAGNAHGDSAASAAVNLTIPDTALSLTLSFADGTTLSFSQHMATDIGGYSGAFVQQQCLRQRAPATGDYRAAFTVYFRPDADDSRQEIVVEYGCDFILVPGSPPAVASGARPTHITLPYVATISGGGLTAPITVSVPKHWWGARWRWQSSSRPIMRGYADLLTTRAILPLSTRAVWNTDPPAAYPWGGPMTIAHLQADMGTAGDREEVGFINEYEACYLLTGNANAQTSMVSTAEAAGSIPIWVRDSTTGALLNVQSYPYLAQRFDAFGGSHKITQPPNPSDPSFVNTEASHFPSLSFVMWVLTDDPWHLEGCQAAAVYAMTEGNYHNNAYNLPGLASCSSTRGWAWGMRDLFRMAAFCPASVPSWLLPQSHWQQCVADNLNALTQAMAGRGELVSVHPAMRVFPLFPDASMIASFMIDYLEIVMGWAGWCGAFPGWAGGIAWLAQPRTVMAADPALRLGWDRRWPVPYDWTIPSPTPLDWPTLWNDYVAARGGGSTNWSSPSSWPVDGLAPNLNLGYVAEARAALAALQPAGILYAADEHTWLYQQMAAILPSAGTPTRYKWAIWPTV
jgi:hypothetical protein